MGSLMWLMMFGMFVVVVLIIAGIVLLIRTMSPRSAGDKPKNSAERILQERFTRGEIDRDEFQQRIALLRSQRHGSEKT